MRGLGDADLNKGAAGADNSVRRRGSRLVTAGAQGGSVGSELCCDRRCRQRRVQWETLPNVGLTGGPGQTQILLDLPLAIIKARTTLASLVFPPTASHQDLPLAGPGRQSKGLWEV